MVIADDDRIDGRYLEVHQSILTLLATQAPVATDLRLIAALLHVMKSRRAHGRPVREHRQGHPADRPRAAADEQMIRDILTMGQQVRSLITQAKQAFIDSRCRAGPRPRAPGRRRRQPEQASASRAPSRSATTWTRREWAMTMMLVARALERIGDNAVDIGEQTAFVVTGLFREFEDASHPESALG